MRTVQGQMEQYVQSGAPVPPEAAVAARNITRARAPGRHGRLQPGHDHRAAPGAPRDPRRRRAAQARLHLPGPPGRDPRAQGPHPVRGQVRARQEPARVHPARAAEGHPARARRGRSAAGRGGRAARQGRGLGHARRRQGARAQGSRPHEPHPHGLAGSGRHPHLRRLAREPAVGQVHRGQPRHQAGGRRPRRGPLRPREGQGAHPRVPLGALAGGHHPQPHPGPRRPARRGQDLAGQVRGPGHGPRVRAHEPGRHPRRGRESGATGVPTSARCPVASSRTSRRPAPTTPSSCSTRSTRSAWTSAATRRRPSSRSSTRSRTTPSRTTTSRCPSTSRRCSSSPRATSSTPSPWPCATAWRSSGCRATRSARRPRSASASWCPSR